MVNERLVWYLENNGLLAKQQCCYRSNRSTVDHLVRLETFIRDAFIHNQHLVAVFFDLQKAYDTTWKYGIFKDLHSMGLRGNLPIFIDNFLSDRTFQIHLGTILSDKIFHQEGVPQGAILSTTLFNVKINDIVKQVDPGVETSGSARSLAAHAFLQLLDFPLFMLITFLGPPLQQDSYMVYIP